MVPQQQQQPPPQTFSNQTMSQSQIQAREHFMRAKLKHGGNNDLQKSAVASQPPLTRSVSDDKRRNSLKHMPPHSDRRESLPDLKLFPKNDPGMRRRHSLASTQGIKEEDRVSIKSKVSGNVYCLVNEITFLRVDSKTCRIKRSEKDDRDKISREDKRACCCIF